MVSGKDSVKEWSCQCKNCGKKWAYLDSVEKDLKRMQTSNLISACGMCNPATSMYAANKNTDLKMKLEELKQCPNCKSSNVVCKAKYFKKE